MAHLSTLVSDAPYTVLMSEEHVLFGDWLWEHLNQRGWGVSDFAERASVSPSSVSRWASNKRLPDPPSCVLIAGALNLDVDTVLERAGHRPGIATDLSAMDPRLRIYMLGFPNLTPEFQRLLLRQMEALYQEAEAFRRERDRDERTRS